MSTKKIAVLIAGALASMVTMGCNAQEQQQWREATPIEKRLVQTRATELSRQDSSGTGGFSSPRMMNLQRARERVENSSMPNENWTPAMHREYLKINVLDVHMERLNESLKNEFPNKRVELNPRNVQHGLNDNAAFGVIVGKSVDVTDVLVKED